jgi:TonB family protein
MSADWTGIQNGNPAAAVKEKVTQLGLDYRLMTQFTSFVAVEEMTITDGGRPRRMDVPVELPEGMNREGLIGGKTKGDFERLELQAKLQRPPKTSYNQLYLAQISAGADAPVPPAPLPAGKPLPTVVDPKTVSISGGVLQGNITKKVQPAYPPIAKAAGASGAVQVQVAIDEAGNVVEATAISGHPLLRAAAVDAAKQWTFRPTLINGAPLRIHGVLTFNFTLDGKAAAKVTDAPFSLSPEEQRRQQSLAKLHRTVQAVVLRLENKTTNPTADEAKFVHDGKAEVEVWVADKSDATIESLKKLGFEVVLNPQSSKLVIGRLSIEKLIALADLPAVRHIAPTNTLSQK